MGVFDVHCACLPALSTVSAATISLRLGTSTIAEGSLVPLDVCAQLQFVGSLECDVVVTFDVADGGKAGQHVPLHLCVYCGTSE